MTAQFTQDARSANHFFIYPSAQEDNRNDPADRLTQGQSGNLLVLIYQQPWPNASDPIHITRLIGYFGHQEPEVETATLRRFTINFPVNDYKNALQFSVESLLPTTEQLRNAKVVIEKTRRNETDGMFLNFENRSIVVQGEIIHGHQVSSENGNYNFTISPRG